MAKKKKNKTKAQAIKSAKRKAMKNAGLLDGRLLTRIADDTPKQKNRRDRRKAKRKLGRN